VKRVLIVPGSARSRALSKRLAGAALAAVERGAGRATLIDLAEFDLPLYHADLEAREGLPEAAQRLQGLIAGHDALLIASPEYNGSMTPLLVNTLDWCSRVDPTNASGSGLAIFADKPAALVGLLARAFRWPARTDPPARPAGLPRDDRDSAADDRPARAPGVRYADGGLLDESQRARHRCRRRGAASGPRPDGPRARPLERAHPRQLRQPAGPGSEPSSNAVQRCSTASKRIYRCGSIPRTRSSRLALQAGTHPRRDDDAALAHAGQLGVSSSGARAVQLPRSNGCTRHSRIE